MYTNSLILQSEPDKNPPERQDQQMKKHMHERKAMGGGWGRGGNSFFFPKNKRCVFLFLFAVRGHVTQGRVTLDLPLQATIYHNRSVLATPRRSRGILNRVWGDSNAFNFVKYYLNPPLPQPPLKPIEPNFLVSGSYVYAQ